MVEYRYRFGLRQHHVFISTAEVQVLKRKVARSLPVSPMYTLPHVKEFGKPHPYKNALWYSCGIPVVFLWYC